MKKFYILCSILPLISTGVAAADLSSGTPDYFEPVESSSKNWATRFGVAFDTYYAHNADGVSADGWKIGGNVDFAVAHETAGGLGAQFDILGSLFADNDVGDSDDWTRGLLTSALHLYKSNQSGRYGLFGGGGISEDTGDSDEEQYFWFAGVEGQMTGPDGSIYFAQGGYSSGSDEYEEGLYDAGFVRVGGRKFTSPNTAYLVAVSGAYGKTASSPDDSLVGNIELEAERALGDGSTSVFASYEGTVIDVDSNEDEETSDYHGFMLGMRWRPGASDLMSAYSGPASFDLPSIGRWFSFTANEIEN